MRALALLVFCGCRSILGIEDVKTIDESDDDASMTGGEMVGNEMMGGEPSSLNCPGNFQALANSGPRNHRYLAVTTQDSWTIQFDSCKTLGGFLAFPDGTNNGNAQLELAAILAFTGPNVWLGVSDDASGESVIFNSLNQPASNVTVSLVSNNTAQNDCGAGQSSTEIRFEACANNHKAVCECVP